MTPQYKEKTPKTFKIKPYHKMMLSTNPFVKAPGLLVCLLLDAFFDGELPQLRAKYDALVKAQANSKKGTKIL